VQVTDARGIVTNLSYDNAGRLLAKQYPAAPAENVIYTWDATGGGNKGKGRVTRIQDAGGAVEWTYNSLGQMVQEKKTTGTAVYTVGYGYDLDGNITGITYPSGRVVSYGRDAIGRISGVTSRTNAGTVTLADGVTWMPSGPLQSLSYGNGLTQIRTYSQDYLIAQMLVTDASSGTDVVNRWYGRSDAVNITDIVDNIDAYRSESYLYTPTGRLENASGPWACTAMPMMPSATGSWSPSTAAARSRCR
jgi:YD repeat-containing protein